MLHNELKKPNLSQYQVPGHPDTENLWERILDIKAEKRAEAQEHEAELALQRWKRDISILKEEDMQSKEEAKFLRIIEEQLDAEKAEQKRLSHSRVNKAQKAIEASS